MSKIPLVVLGLLLLGVLRLQSAGFGWAEGLLGGGAAAAPAAAYLDSIGTAAPVALADAIDFTGWFPAATEPRESPVWRAIDAAAVEAGTPAGWAALCAQASAAVGADRTADPQLGALACSADVAVTGLQSFALQVLATQAAVALWMTGEPGFVASTIDGRQGELRLACEAGLLPPHDVDSSLGQACIAALDLAWQSGDGDTTLASLETAYSAIASEIALRDPETDLEPASAAAGEPAAGADGAAPADPAAASGDSAATGGAGADDTADPAP